MQKVLWHSWAHTSRVRAESATARKGLCAVFWLVRSAGVGIGFIKPTTAGPSLVLGARPCASKAPAQGATVGYASGGQASRHRHHWRQAWDCWATIVYLKSLKELCCRWAGQQGQASLAPGLEVNRDRHHWRQAWKCWATIVFPSGLKELCSRWAGQQAQASMTTDTKPIRRAAPMDTVARVVVTTFAMPA
eukprot:1159691-Pelagomonas_calceolata.AAC.3